MKLRHNSSFAKHYKPQTVDNRHHISDGGFHSPGQNSSLSPAQTTRPLSSNRKRDATTTAARTRGIQNIYKNKAIKNGKHLGITKSSLLINQKSWIGMWKPRNYARPLPFWKCEEEFFETRFAYETNLELIPTLDFVFQVPQNVRLTWSALSAADS